MFRKFLLFISRKELSLFELFCFVLIAVSIPHSILGLLLVIPLAVVAAVLNTIINTVAEHS